MLLNTTLHLLTGRCLQSLCRLRASTGRCGRVSDRTQFHLWLSPKKVILPTTFLWSIRWPFSNRASIVVYLPLKLCKVLAWLVVQWLERHVGWVRCGHSREQFAIGSWVICDLWGEGRVGILRVRTRYDRSTCYVFTFSQCTMACHIMSSINSF